MAGGLGNVVLVLYQPRGVVNVAGVVRVMSNFGLGRLRLVEPAAFDPYRIEGIAHHTADLVAAVERCATLERAVEDCGLVLGTTGRPRETRRDRLEPREAAPALLAAGAAGPAAVLFGPEQDGLPNSVLDQCHGLITIPTDPGNRSLNLAQAALVVAYELFMAARAPAPRGAPGLVQALAGAAPLAAGVYRDELFQALEDLLQALFPGTTADRMALSMSRLRAVLLRAAPRSDEARMLAHLFQHMAQLARRAAPGGAAPAREPGG